MKTCRRCDRDKPLGEFGRDARRQDGKRVRCKDCDRDTQLAKKQGYRDRLAELKDGPCADCGGSFPPCAMEFDHVRGDRLYGIGINTIMRSDTADELAKCELRCANCHRVRHYAVSYICPAHLDALANKE